MYSGCSYKIVIKRLIKKLETKSDVVIKFQTQVCNITTNLKVEIDFTLPELSAKKAMTCKCHVDDSTKVIYNIILGRDIEERQIRFRLGG